MRLFVIGHCGWTARTSASTHWARLGSYASVRVAAVLMLSACASSAANVKDGDAAQDTRAQKWGRAHQFDDSGMDVLEADIDGDGRANVKKVSRGGVVQREEWDLNGDGQIEVWRYFDATGTLVEEEWDADFDGHADVIAYYEGGQLTLREESNNFLGKMTTRKHYRDGIVTLVEQDTDDNGRFDTWEFYEAGKLVKIGRDSNGDGKEDTFSKPTAAMAALAPEPPRAPTTPPTPTTPEPTETPAPATDSGGKTSGDGGEPAETPKTP